MAEVKGGSGEAFDEGGGSDGDAASSRGGGSRRSSFTSTAESTAIPDAYAMFLSGNGALPAFSEPSVASDYVVQRHDAQGRAYRNMLQRVEMGNRVIKTLPREGKLRNYTLGRVSKKLFRELEINHPTDEHGFALPRPGTSGRVKTADAVDGFKHLQRQVTPGTIPQNLAPRQVVALGMQEELPSAELVAGLEAANAARASGAAAFGVGVAAGAGGAISPPPTIAQQQLLERMRQEELRLDTGGTEPPVHAPPGLAPQVARKSKSLGAEKFYNYQGTWQSGAMHGHGTFTFYDGGQYRGDWQDNQPHGTGTALYTTGTEYEGEWDQGRKQGHGKTTFANGSVYEGAYERGRRHGKGRLALRNGVVYEGDFHRGQRHGRGRITSRNTAFTYEGTWVKGYICGSGTLIDPDGKRIVRQWPKCTLREAIASVKAEALHKAREKREENWDLDRMLRKMDLEQYVAEVREYNAEAERERLEMEEAERLRIREERRQKVREARAAAAEAAAAAAEAALDAGEEPPDDG